MDLIRPPGFDSHSHMSRQPFGTLQKEGDAYSSERLNFDRCKELTGCATHLQNLHTMITIRSSAASSKPTLIGLEVILTTPRSTYMISSNGSVADFSSPFGGGLFWRDLLAAIAVPTRFRGRAGTADVFSKRWISSCILLATTRSIAPARAAHSQAVVFRLRPTLLSRSWFPL